MTLPDILPKSVSLGYSTIHVYGPTQIEGAQLGYAYDLEGNWLAGQADGDWQATWTVIGYENLCGDPIFVDRQTDSLAVYTATHGTGSWKPVMIAASLQDFEEALKIIEEVAKGRETPVRLEHNPISSDERENALTEIRKITQVSEIEFWESLLEK